MLVVVQLNFASAVGSLVELEQIVEESFVESFVVAAAVVV